MKNLFFLFLFSVACLFSACDNTMTVLETPSETTNPVINKAVFSGYVQKGPYVNGSSVMITLLDEQLNQTGSVYTTQIIDNSGNFEQKNLKFTSHFIELKADGYFFNEVKGENSNGSLTLYALADISDINSVNINILTHLERPRIIYLMQNDKLSFPEAKKQARKEVLGIFQMALSDSIASESLDLKENALLLAVSVIIQGQLNTGDLSELLANISLDIRTDGRLDNPLLGTQLMNNVAFLDLDQIKSNVEKRYNTLGITVNVNSDELKNHIDQFKNNCGFAQTLSIIYPERGKYGPNILADDFVECKRFENGKLKPYSLRAELPAGNSSLKIILKTKNTSDFSWGGYYQGSEENWIITNWDNSIKGNSLTVYASGKPADVSVTLESDFIIEYYENGAITPTKVKTVYVDKGDTAKDDEHERKMLIAFYQSANGDNWSRKDNWCSNKPLSEWYGIETVYHPASGKSRVQSIRLSNNNLTGSANLTDIKSLYFMDIVDGNKIESLTIDNCGNERSDNDLNNSHHLFYHNVDANYSPCNLKALNISNSGGYIYVNGNFSAETVTISDCNLTVQEIMYFNLPSTKIGTITVSNCTMNSFVADNSIVGSITIDNCTFLEDASRSGACIHVGNKTSVNNCKGLRYIYSRKCSDLTVTNTVCDDIRCGN